MRFDLPAQIRPLIAARNELRRHYADVDLRFTLDGNLVGDLGEAIAATMFGLSLSGRSFAGIDGYASDGRTVQVKASGTGRGAAFRKVEVSADHLLFFHLDFDGCYGDVVYNGPERYVKQALPAHWVGQKVVSVSVFRRLNEVVPQDERLLPLSKLIGSN